MRVTQMMVSAALLALTATALPAAALAGGLVDAGVSLGGGSLAKVDVDANLGGINADANAKVGNTSIVNASVGTTTGTTVTTSPKSASAVKAQADAAGVLHARARVLGRKQLLKLCITVGAKGCDGASRSRQIALVDARARVLSPAQLASACVTAGGSCGGAAASGSSGGTSSPAASRLLGAGSARGVAMASAEGDMKDRDTRITCRSVLASPARYEAGLVKLCRKIGQ